MKILLKNKATGNYLAERGQWVENPEMAKSFATEEQAKEYIGFRKLPAVAVKLTEPGDLEVPAPKPAPVNKAAKQRQAILTREEPKNAEPGVAVIAAAEPAKSIPLDKPCATKEKTQIPSLPAKPQRDKRLTIEAKIDVGFGNALFIRGQGAGLSWEKGQLLNCVDRTTWVWSSERADDKAVFKLLLNDQVWAQGGDLVIEPGKSVAITPAF